ncbi:hypothetical protein KAU19_07605 [Candidatus Parcubacteria bacterium]|nr:hypothetical protein [Candidatus Parcubacteria bacterium]
MKVRLISHGWSQKDRKEFHLDIVLVPGSKIEEDATETMLSKLSQENIKVSEQTSSSITLSF